MPLVPILVAAAAVNAHTASLYTAVSITTSITAVTGRSVTINVILARPFYVAKKLLVLILCQEVLMKLSHYFIKDVLWCISKFPLLIVKDGNKLIGTGLPFYII